MSFLPPDRGVEYLDQVDDQEGDAQSEQEGDSRNQHGIGRHGRGEPYALSIVRELLSVMTMVMAFSSRLLSR